VLAAGGGVHDVEFVVFGAGRGVGDEADGGGNEKDADPAVDGEVLVQPEAAEERDDDVAEGGGGHYEGEVCPGERGHVAGEEADEQDDADVDEGVEERVPEQAEVVEVDGADLGHAAGEQGITDRGGEHDADEDGVLRGFEAVLHSGRRYQDTKREQSEEPFKCTEKISLDLQSSGDTIRSNLLYLQTLVQGDGVQ
jgi:hypothetical protein